MCLYPKFILNRKYRPNKKNGGNVPQMTDPRTRYVPVGCGKCMECRKQRSRNWQVRLQEEIRNNNTGKFVTMTFTDKALIQLEKEITDEDPRIKGYELENEIATLAVRRFTARWIKKYDKSVRHWLVTELGQNKTERLHIHGIVFTNKTLDELRDRWQYGNVNKWDKDWKTNYCTERTVNYIVKYISKTDEKHKYYNPKVLTSKGIGANYINREDSKANRYIGEKTNEYYYTRQGIKLPLPIYYRNKIYNDEEREELWINLLNKDIRYVNGLKIDISKNETDYENVLKSAREKNNILGYGDDQKNWNQIKYEQDRRNLKRLQRIKNEELYKDDVYRNPMIANKEICLGVNANAKKDIDYETGEIYSDTYNNANNNNRM